MRTKPTATSILTIALLKILFGYRIVAREGEKKPVTMSWTEALATFYVPYLHGGRMALQGLAETMMLHCQLEGEERKVEYRGTKGDESTQAVLCIVAHTPGVEANPQLSRELNTEPNLT